MALNFSIAIFVLVTINSVFGKSFTIVVDTTVSMQDEIYVIQSNIPAVASVLANVTDFENFIVIPFNDADVFTPMVTTEPGKLIQALNNLIVRGGGTDCPEDSLSSIQKALTTSQSESYIYVFTDAYAKYTDKLKEIEDLCKDTQSRVVIFLSGNCSPSDSNSSVGNVDVYYDIAKACSGAVFRIAAVNVRKAFRYIKDMIKTDYNDVVNHDAFSGYKQFTFTIDSSTTDVLLALSGDYPILQIADSDGNSPNNVEKLVDTRQSLVVRASKLKAGEYRATARCHGSTYLTFYRKNRLSFEYGFSTRLPNSLKETSLRPMPGWTNYILITLQDVENVRINAIELEFIATNTKKSIILEEKTDRKGFFIASILIESGKSFRMKIVGKDELTYDDIHGTTKIIEPQKLYKDVQWSSPITEILQPASNLIDYGTNVTIACRVIGYPKPTIWWEDDEQTTLVSEDVLLEIPSTYLSFVNVEDMSSNFTLYCKSKNAQGDEATGIELFVNRTLTFEVLQSPTDQSVEYGTTGKLYCEVDAYPYAEIKWYHNGTALEFSDNIEEDADDNALVIKNMTLADVGNYTCEITNEGNKEVLSAFVSISGLEAPEVRLRDEEKILKPGDWVEIECIVDKGNPSPEISWDYKTDDDYDYKALPSEVFVDNGKLKIASVKTENRGYYRCTASNMMGQGSGTVSVKIQYPPRIQNAESSTLDVKEGDMVKLTCEIDAIPDARVRWEMSQNDVIVPFDARHTTDDKNTHRFDALWKDSGNYHCIAENEMGRAEKTVFVNVLVAPYIQPPEAKELSVRAGSTVDLVCLVLYANPAPTTMWQFIAVDSTAAVLSRGTSTNPLRTSIRNVSKADEGMYLCIADNSVGNDRIRINLKVE